MDAYAGANIGIPDRRNDSLTRIKAAARTLFLGRGYHETRPQDIAREAGLGHGTFYLHYKDKRDCFIAFLEDARAEFCVFMRAHVGPSETVEQTVICTLEAIYEFGDLNPGLLNVCMTDEALFYVDSPHRSSTLQLWGTEWAVMIKNDIQPIDGFAITEPQIVGQAILGAINHCRLQTERMDVSREQVIATLTVLLTRALTAKSD